MMLLMGIKEVGAGIMAQCVKMTPPVPMASHTGSGSSPSCFIWDPVPWESNTRWCKVLWSCIHIGNSEKHPGSWLLCDPVQVIVTIRGVNHWMEDSLCLHSLFFILPFKSINIYTTKLLGS